MNTCSGVTQGGRRRSRSRKAKTTRRRKMRGGNFYGVGAPINAGNIERTAVTNDAYDSATGRNLGPDPGAPHGTAPTGGKRRKSRKSTKKSKKSRKIKGGSWSPSTVNVSGVGYGYSSGGSEWASGSGYPQVSSYASRVGGAPMGADGVRRA